jgi:serine protease AprX
MAANEHGFSSDLVGPEQPFDQVVITHLEGARVVAAFVERLDDHVFSDEPFEREKPDEDERPAQQEPPSKIHPVLAVWLNERSPDDRDLILVNLRDDLTIPRFLEPVTGEPRDSQANRGLRSRSEALIGQIVERREGGYRRLAQEFAERYGAEVRQTFWLLRCMLLEAPLRMVPDMAERDDVLYVEPNDAGDVPGQNANPNDDVDDGRGLIVSDPYFNLGLTGGFVGLLDTGLRFTHTLFNSPSHIDFRFDCTGGSGCSTGPGSNPNDDCWDHGTAEAAAFTGNANLGNAFRGVTGITLDSFKVFPTSFNAAGACNGFLNVAAGVSAFQTAVSVFDRVIYGGMQGSGNYLSSLSIAADNAFDAGAVVIGINGNFGPAAGTVNSPGSAHRVIGVGNFDVQTLAQVTSQSRGPTPDGRIKPDIQAPTNTETASNASDTALRTFTGTSGAAPYAAGAAALLRNFLLNAIPVVDPGQVYSVLILSGQQVFPFNNTSGAGPLRLPTDGTLFFGKVAVSNGGTINIPLNIGGGVNLLDAALWWPETATVLLGIPIEFHNDIDLHLLNPGGATVATSLSINSVFERARATGAPLAAGTWTLRIRGFNVPAGPQTVYWSAHAQ